jgi:hypothetical protein
MKSRTIAITLLVAAVIGGCKEERTISRECHALLDRTLNPNYQASAAEMIASNECLGIPREDQRRLNADREAELVDELRDRQDELRRLRMQKEILQRERK